MRTLTSFAVKIAPFTPLVAVKRASVTRLGELFTPSRRLARTSCQMIKEDNTSYIMQLRCQPYMVELPCEPGTDVWWVCQDTMKMYLCKVSEIRADWKKPGDATPEVTLQLTGELPAGHQSILCSPDNLDKEVFFSEEKAKETMSRLKETIHGICGGCCAMCRCVKVTPPLHIGLPAHYNCPWNQNKVVAYPWSNMCNDYTLREDLE